MPRKTNPDDDDWHNVEDSKKRKQIQDRLAQRARRKRLREARVHAKHAREAPETPCDKVVAAGAYESHVLPVSAPPTELCSLIPGIECTDLALWSSVGPTLKLEGLNTMGSELIEFDDSFVPSLLPPVSQPPVPITVFGALYINGQILGLQCTVGALGTTPPVDDSVPVPLRPTWLQLMKAHPRWIDRVPFPKFRNNLINLVGIIDDEEFLHDVFTIPSFQLKPGNSPWDPRGWQMEKPFADKWGYLFY